MSYESVTSRIKQIMERIENVYNVHQYLRDIPDEAEFEKAFRIERDDKNILTAWMMTRSAVDSEYPTIDASQIYDVTHRIEIQGFYGLSDADASEREFQELIDNMLDKFRTKFTLESETDGTPLSGILMCSALQVSEIGHGQFGQYFVHFCRMLLSVEERLQ